ncbi:MAG: hypothetical protein JO061_00530, partial [Acidobacteriaceae bacterium]|nr:hypothetical protein [Acidobacteriaceae bacterium]
RILTESASAKLATPITLKFDELDKNALGYNAQQASWNFLQPWPGGTWHLSDIIDYQMIAFQSVLYNAAIHREDMVRNYYRIGQDQAGRTKPCAFVIPAKQRDPGATRRLLETLEFGRVEVQRAPNGDHVILMQQPYSGWAKALLERQNYPDLRVYPGGPPQRPYDTTAETLPLLFGVDVKTVDEPLAGPLTKETFDWDRPAPESFSASDTDAWVTVAKLWNESRPVWRNTHTGDFSPADKGPDWKKVAPPRIALYRSYDPAMDEGWTRWLLEKFGFAYKNVSNADFQKGDLKKVFDVIIFPDQQPNTILQGYKAGSMPEEYTGGIGDGGIRNVKAFAQSGGTVLCLNRSASFCISRLGANAKNVLANRVARAAGDYDRNSETAPTGARQEGNREGNPGGDFYSPGSLLNVKLDLRSPLTFGLPDHIAIWNEQSPAFISDAQTVATYPGDNVLASGWLLGADLIAGRSAIVDDSAGQGHIVLFGMRPQYRAQSYQAFKLFFNALIAYE